MKSSIINTRRLAGPHTRTKALLERFAMDPSGVHMEDEDTCDDIHTASGLLKQYVRELPGSLTAGMYPQFIAAASLPAAQRVAGLASVVAQLPKENRDTLHTIVTHLARVAEFSSQNKVVFERMFFFSS
ncbi:MAG: hypothetical protein JSS07_12790 [Proteobacteria bacterium]|nr:hypothetical protein [Pseudomonadota bacterium]